MARNERALAAFNRGIVSRLALARSDLKRLAFSATQQRNWMPRALGSMMLRPGMAYIGTSSSSNAARALPFVYSATDTAMLELTSGELSVWVSDAAIVRPSVSTIVTNGTMTGSLAGWTNNDQAGCTSSYNATPTGAPAGGYMQLVGNGTNFAIRDQQVAVVGADIGAEHALHVLIERGPVVFSVGTSLGADDLFSQATLARGAHSLAFTPAGASFYIRFKASSKSAVLVDSCVIEGAGLMLVETPWQAADLNNVRAGPEAQSADVVFVACSGYQQRRIERRTTRSFSVVRYLPSDGPFRATNTTTITISSSAISGSVTLTASAPIFKSTHVDALWQLISVGQIVSKSGTALNDATGSIRVIGVGTDRAVALTITGLTATGNTVVLERSTDNATFTPVAGSTWVADITTTYNDTLDNQILYYRLRISVYAAGTTVMTLSIGSGSIVGTARIIAYTSSTVVSADVLIDLGGTSFTEWAEGAWSDYRGWPTSITLCESRLCNFGKGGFWASQTDGYDLYTDIDAEGNPIGDSGPIQRTIGFGPVDVVAWGAPVTRLLMGGEGQIYSIRSTAFDEPLTNSNSNIKGCSTQGSARVQPVKVDSTLIYTQASGRRVYELSFDGQSYDYVANDLSVLWPEVAGDPESGTTLVRMAVQRQPDTRVHLVRSDGQAVVIVRDRAENVLCWVQVDCSEFSGGAIEDVCVLPAESGTPEDRVYYLVRYTINSATVRYWMRWAREGQCVGGTLNRQADAFVVGTNSPASNVISGLTHLIGATVIVWADGACPANSDGTVRTFVVSATGQIVMPSAVSSYLVGGGYTATFNTTRLQEAIGFFGSIDHVSLMLQDTHARGLQFGPDASHLEPLPLVYNGVTMSADGIFSTYADQPLMFPGQWSTDPRLYMLAQAPRPCTVVAALVGGEVNA